MSSETIIRRVTMKSFAVVCFCLSLWSLANCNSADPSRVVRLLKTFHDMNGSDANLEQVEALLPKLVPCVENKLAQMDSETVDSMFGFLDVYEKCMRGSLGETSTQREAEFKSCLEKNSDRPEHNIKLVGEALGPCIR